MSEFLNKISPFMVMDILQQARQMPHAVHMEVGEPDIPPSRNVITALQKAIEQKKFYYTPAKGLPELRERISVFYKEKYNVDVPAERIIITPGTSGAFLVAFSLTATSQKRVILTDPSYPCYKNFLYFLNKDPMMIPVGPESGYQLSPERLTEGVSAVVVSSPSNPTGTVYDPSVLKELIETADKKGIWFISDEIYHGLDYSGKTETALRYSDRAIVINGFSKYFCMPGLRIGWLILPPELVRQAEIIVQNIFIAANTPAQYAALEAFDDSYLSTVREEFRSRRDYLYDQLRRLFRIDAPAEGAFYIWADISKFSHDCVQFCRDLLKAKAVAITPGVDFGKNNTHKYVRFAYTQQIHILQEGVRRIKEFLQEAFHDST